MIMISQFCKTVIFIPYSIYLNSTIFSYGTILARVYVKDFLFF